MKEMETAKLYAKVHRKTKLVTSQQYIFRLFPTTELRQTMNIMQSQEIQITNLLKIYLYNMRVKF
jgi:hypothetical protein